PQTGASCPQDTPSCAPLHPQGVRWPVRWRPSAGVVGVVIKGLVRPCRHGLGPELQERWRAHLCGLCLTLRDEAGQSARVLTGYDALLLSVLVEAQAGVLPTTTAGRCPLRGMRTAEVVRGDL